MTEIGSYAITLAFGLSIYGAFACFWGGQKGSHRFQKSGRNAVVGVAALLSLAAVALIYALVTRDFRVHYVAAQTNRSLSMVYTVSAFYAGLEGSLLFWGWILAVFAAAVVCSRRSHAPELLPQVGGVLLVLLTFFTLLLTSVADPFALTPAAPADGRGLNPLLQNPGMFFHPPTLYLGYIGFSIPYAYAMAALIQGRLGDGWIRSTRKWTLVAWYFLALGNLFGAWWAYKELGWGGFWMWDPVENASFMPWLTGTAFLHSVMIQEKRGMLKMWNMGLIIATFGLTLFGTFLTRSGVISSIHSFAESPLGPFFLGFLGLVLFGSLALLYRRREALKGENHLDSLLSKESAFLFNNLLLVGIAFAVLWGTVFPLITEAVRKVEITVGPPFYNQVTIPIFLALLALTGVCPLIAWRRASKRNLERNFLLPVLAGGVVAASLWVGGVRSTYPLLSFGLGAFVAATIVLEFSRGVRVRREGHREAPAKALVKVIAKNKRRYGGYLIHIGIILMFVGVTGKAFQVERQEVMLVGDTMEIGGYSLRYEGLTHKQDPLRFEVAAKVAVAREGRALGYLYPAKRFYTQWEQPTTEVAIRSTPREDLFLILAGYEEGSVAIKAIINPLITWLWIGGFIMTLGATVCLLPDRKLDAGKKGEGRGVGRSGLVPAYADAEGPVPPPSEGEERPPVG